jgi:hypothetical protein
MKCGPCMSGGDRLISHSRSELKNYAKLSNKYKQIRRQGLIAHLLDEIASEFLPVIVSRRRSDLAGSRGSLQPASLLTT